MAPITDGILAHHKLAERIAHAGSEAVRLVPVSSLPAVSEVSTERDVQFPPQSRDGSQSRRCAGALAAILHCPQEVR